MVRKSQEWPEEGELIVGTVYKFLIMEHSKT